MSTADILSRTNDLLASHSALLSQVRDSQRAHRRALRNFVNNTSQDTSNLDTLLNLPQLRTPVVSPVPSRSSSPDGLAGPSNVSQVVRPHPRVIRPDLPPAKKARCARYENYVPEEETIRNDYSQRYVDGGEWPQDWVVGAEMERRFEEYPKQQRLLALKKVSVSEYALPSTYLSISSSKTALQGLKFDSILIDPPFSSSFTWEQLESLPVQSLAADPSFIFLWVGSGAGEGLERGREILGKWGYRRCEDIVWIKTNKDTNKGPGTDPPTTSLLTRTKQHCLMGIRGTVRRSTDSWFVHCNIDTDIIVWEGDPTDPTRKPPEMYQLIENFCLGTRRLEVFGRYHSLRRGWVTVTADDLNLTSEEAREKDDAVPFQRETWEAQMKEFAQNGAHVVPNSAEIESLRPKSPSQRSGKNVSVSAAPMSSPPTGLPNNAIRPMSGLGITSGGTSGGVAMGLPKANNSFPAQPMNMVAAGAMNTMNPGGMAGITGMAPTGNMGPGMNWQGGGPGNMMPRMGDMSAPVNAMGRQGVFNQGFDGSGANASFVAMQPGFDPGMNQGMTNMNQSMTGMNQGMMGMNQGMAGMNMNMTGMTGMNTGMTGMNQMNPAIMGANPQLGFGFDGGQGAWMGGPQGDFGGMDGGMGQQMMGQGGIWDGNFMGNGGMTNPGGMGAGFGQGMRQWRNF